MHAMFLKENKKPKWEPHKLDWYVAVTDPQPILVHLRDDPAESEVDSFINSEDIIDVDNEGLGSLDQTFEQEPE